MIGREGQTLIGLLVLGISLTVTTFALPILFDRGGLTLLAGFSLGLGVLWSSTLLNTIVRAARIAGFGWSVPLLVLPPGTATTIYHVLFDRPTTPISDALLLVIAGAHGTIVFVSGAASFRTLKRIKESRNR